MTPAKNFFQIDGTDWVAEASNLDVEAVRSCPEQDDRTH